mmetsp:Transcript_4549/g.10244  ORF Transcript_4549/g.10244 Transcript_4549/m.10244 type:complete len:411 (+) Transcript_4549:4830-6062(+)
MQSFLALALSKSAAVLVNEVLAAMSTVVSVPLARQRPLAAATALPRKAILSPAAKPPNAMETAAGPSFLTVCGNMAMVGCWVILRAVTTWEEASPLAALRTRRQIVHSVAALTSYWPAGVKAGIAPTAALVISVVGKKDENLVWELVYSKKAPVTALVDLVMHSDQVVAPRVKVVACLASLSMTMAAAFCMAPKRRVWAMPTLPTPMYHLAAARVVGTVNSRRMATVLPTLPPVTILGVTVILVAEETLLMVYVLSSRSANTILSPSKRLMPLVVVMSSASTAAGAPVAAPEVSSPLLERPLTSLVVATVGWDAKVSRIFSASESAARPATAGAKVILVLVPPPELAAPTIVTTASWVPMETRSPFWRRTLLAFSMLNSVAALATVFGSVAAGWFAVAYLWQSTPPPVAR